MTTFRGVFPALVSAQDNEGNVIYEAVGELARRELGLGAAGFLVNGHTGELMLLSGDERRHTLRAVREAVGPEIPLIAGVHVQALWKFAAQAESAAAMGADAVLMFSPFAFARGAFQYAPEAVVDFYRQAASASPVPLFFMQYRPQTNLMMPRHVLVEVASLPNVVGIKQEVEDNIEYERDYAALKTAKPEFAIFTATDRNLFANYAVGADGCTIGLANLVGPVKAIQDAAWGGDLEAARRAAEELIPIADSIYSPPSYRWSARLKYAIHSLGWIPTPHIRSPLFAATPDERKVIDAALEPLKVAA